MARTHIGNFFECFSTISMIIPIIFIWVPPPPGIIPVLMAIVLLTTFIICPSDYKQKLQAEARKTKIQQMYEY